MNQTGISESPVRRLLDSSPASILAVAAVYAAVAKLSFLFTIPPGNVSPIFPAAGVALAAVIILGRKALIGVWLGSFVANILSLLAGAEVSFHNIWPALLVASFIGIGATAGAGAGAVLVRRFCRNDYPLYSGRAVLILVAVGALGCCAISPTFGVLSMSLGGFIPWDRFYYSWITWWMGDATGAIIAAPLVLAWHHPHPFRRNPWRAFEATVLGTMVIALCFFAFFRDMPFAYGLIPLLLWAAFRFGMRGASTAAAAVAILATIGTNHGGSPFAIGTVNESLLFLHSFLDVTIVCALFLAGVLAEQKRGEEELRRVNRALRTVSECNQVLVRASDEAALMAGICRLLVEHGGYRMAWVGLAEQDDAKSVRPVAQAGFDHGYLDTVNITWADTERGRGPAGTAIRTRQPTIARNIQTDPAFEPWREAASQRGYVHSAALPLMSDERVFGALTVYAAEVDTFNTREMELLEELAGDIGYGIMSLRARAQRRRDAAELQESETRHRFLFEHNPMPMLIYERGTLRMLAVNEAFRQGYGYSREEALALRLTDLYPEEEKAKIAELIPSLHGHRNVGEWHHRKSDGSYVTNVVFSHDLEYQGRNARVAVMTDITDRKRVEDEIAEANLELRALNRIVSAMITGVLNLHQLLDFVLEEALNVVGLEGGTICLTTQEETLELVAQKGASEEVVNDLTTNRVNVGECLCGDCVRTRCPLILRNRAEVLEYSTRESARGEIIQYHAAFPLVTNGKCVGVLCVFTRTDNKPPERRLNLLETVTAQVAMAIQNARLYEKIHHHAGELELRVTERTAELAVARDHAEAADRMKSAFLATMSHELRTPLNSIIGFTGIILRGLAGPLNQEQTKQLGMVQSSARHLLALINDVLDISKIEAGELKIMLAPFDLRKTIERSVAAIRPLAEARHLALRLEISPGIGELVSDARRVEQILLNLLNNAVKFTEHGTVALSAETVGATVRVQITDTGIGIKPEDLAELFRPFKQVASGLSRSHEGTGLGLVICRRLAELLGGEIQVQSVPSRGSTFTVVLPRKNAST